MPSCGKGRNPAVHTVSGINLANVIKVSFTALEGARGNGACNNQSDFTLVQFVTAVPEPGSLCSAQASWAWASPPGAARRPEEGDRRKVA